jgi:PD-(D/E)XK nuclease superfamily
MKSFETWAYEEINITFGMERLMEHPSMEVWLSAEFDINPYILQRLESIRVKSLREVETWNEDELKFMVIAPLIDMVDFEDNNKNYKVFTQRRLSAKIQDVEVSGIVDCIVSTGVQIPKKPFFFVHEYKQERKRENDPLGQLLIAMLAAQAKNESDKPIYGVYVIGRFWFFTFLVGKEYMVNYALDISRKEDNTRIFKMLMYVKQKIESYFL